MLELELRHERGRVKRVQHVVDSSLGEGLHKMVGANGRAQDTDAIVGDLHLALSTAGDAELSDGLCRGPWGFSKGLLWGENDPFVVPERAL